MRQALGGIESWHVFGGSWGSTMALCLALAHPTRVKSLTLRGIYLCRVEDVRAWLHECCPKLYPEAYQRFVEAANYYGGGRPPALSPAVSSGSLRLSGSSLDSSDFLTPPSSPKVNLK